MHRRRSHRLTVKETGSSALVSQRTKKTWPSNRETEGFRPFLRPDSDDGEGSSVDGATGDQLLRHGCCSFKLECC
ncbi:hypothetical protein ES332_D02G179900v1 [Gossypium tomentosum]|uniref:Uncharacterized protein n=1 Tax=Gossypium tomentosum TaxID=34277 RepID=A0A5D2LYN3_GOSTO|nr:hypothetical protein ES332_D02G179900v1 [Gossypium tomentosum]